MDGNHNCLSIHFDIQARIAWNRLEIKYFPNLFAVFSLEGPPEQILDVKNFIISVFRDDRGLFGEYFLTGQFLGVLQVSDTCNPQESLGRAFLLERLKKKGNRKSIEHDEHRFL